MSGRLPYEATSLSELALKQQRESPVPLSTLNTEVPPRARTGGRLAISIDEENRPADALAFATLVRDGAKGISPYGPDAATAHLGGRAATRVMPRRDREPETAATRVVRDDRTPSPRGPIAGRRNPGPSPRAPVTVVPRPGSHGRRHAPLVRPAVAPAPGRPRGPGRCDG